MSSRLFQNVREKRGLAYAVFSGLSAYRDAGSMTIYAGCANDAVGELIDVVIAELRRLKDEPLPDSELRRAKDHLKGSLMLNLESTSSRMSHLARQEIYFDRQFGLDETLRASSASRPEMCSASRAICSPMDRWPPRCLARSTACRFRGKGWRSVSGLGFDGSIRNASGDPAMIRDTPRNGSHLERPAASTKPGCRLRSPQPKRWRGPASSRRTPRATSASAARFDIARIEEIEQITQHDVIAFTTAVAEHVGPSARWLHFGLTSSDVIDTAQALQMREACDLILTGSTV